MQLKSTFISSFRIWFFSLLGMNLITLMFLNTMTQQSKPFHMTYAVIVTNILLSYLLFGFLFKKNEEIKAACEDDNNLQPFNEWIWFGSDRMTQGLTWFTMAVWTIINFIHCFNLEGLGYFLAIFFIATMTYWGFILIVYIRSSRSGPQIV